MRQLALPIQQQKPVGTVRERLLGLLAEDLDFHGQDSRYASHNFHSFPAKFPPQLPRKFILGLTAPGDRVLDPMMGSGTTVVEAYLTGRHGLGFDIDPLALALSNVKVTPIEGQRALESGKEVLERARRAVESDPVSLERTLQERLDGETRRFVDYWFAPETQIELQALVSALAEVKEPRLRTFLELVFSSIIITKSGGVSLAYDLAHTRPHRAKVVVASDGRVILGGELVGEPSPRVGLLTKRLRSPLVEFEKRLRKSVAGLYYLPAGEREPLIGGGDAQHLPLRTGSVHLIVTSPPYASNAIDYMRAHKFSLVWLGHGIHDLGARRKEYIGGEAISGFEFRELPQVAATVVAEITALDAKKGRVLHRYYSEMGRTLQEMYRVLKPGRCAIVVVGSSVMRGRDTRTEVCLADIGRALGFEVPAIGLRQLDRNRRMMPAGLKVDLDSQIQQRMHHEYVIGFYKPEAPPGGVHGDC